MRAVKKAMRTTLTRVVARAMKVEVVKSGVICVIWGSIGGSCSIGKGGVQ